MRYHTDDGAPVHRSRRTGRTHPRLTRLVARAIREADSGYAPGDTCGRWDAPACTRTREAVRMLILAESGSTRHRRFVRDTFTYRHGV